MADTRVIIPGDMGATIDLTYQGKWNVHVARGQGHRDMRPSAAGLVLDQNKAVVAQVDSENGTDPVGDTLPPEVRTHPTAFRTIAAAVKYYRYTDDLRIELSGNEAHFCTEPAYFDGQRLTITRNPASNVAPLLILSPDLWAIGGTAASVNVTCNAFVLGPLCREVEFSLLQIRHDAPDEARIRDRFPAAQAVNPASLGSLVHSSGYSVLVAAFSQVLLLSDRTATIGVLGTVTNTLLSNMARPISVQMFGVAISALRAQGTARAQRWAQMYTGGSLHVHLALNNTNSYLPADRVAIPMPDVKHYVANVVLDAGNSALRNITSNVPAANFV